MSRWKAALFCGSAILALPVSVGALAQNLPSPALGQPPLYDPQQLPTQHGQVKQFTRTPRGDIDGLILTDGTEVKTPPHLFVEIAYSIKPGDTVSIHGLHAAALPLVQAVSISDEATGSTVIDYGPQVPEAAPLPVLPRRSPGLPRCKAVFGWPCTAREAT